MKTICESLVWHEVKLTGLAAARTILLMWGEVGSGWKLVTMIAGGWSNFSIPYGIVDVILAGDSTALYPQLMHESQNIESEVYRLLKRNLLLNRKG